MRTTFQASILAVTISAVLSCDSATSPTDAVAGCFSVHLADAPTELTPTKLLHLSLFVPPHIDFEGIDLRTAEPSPMPVTPTDWMLDGTWLLRPGDSLHVNAGFSTQMRYRFVRVRVTIQGGPFVPAEWVGTATHMTANDSVTWSGSAALFRTGCAD